MLTRFLTVSTGVSGQANAASKMVPITDNSTAKSAAKIKPELNNLVTHGGPVSSYQPPQKGQFSFYSQARSRSTAGAASGRLQRRPPPHSFGLQSRCAVSSVWMPADHIITGPARAEQQVWQSVKCQQSRYSTLRHPLGGCHPVFS